MDKIPTSISLGVTAFILICGAIYSIWRTGREINMTSRGTCDEPDKKMPVTKDVIDKIVKQDA